MENVCRLLSKLLCVLVAMTLASGCATYKYRSTLKPLSNKGFAVKGTKFNIKSVRYEMLFSEWCQPDTVIPVEPNCKNLMELGRRNYPQIFSLDPTASPLYVTIRAVHSLPSALSMFAKTLCTGLCILPAWMTESCAFEVKLVFTDETQPSGFNGSVRFRRADTSTFSMFTPLGLIGPLGSSDIPSCKFFIFQDPAVFQNPAAIKAESVFQNPAATKVEKAVALAEKPIPPSRLRGRNYSLECCLEAIVQAIRKNITEEMKEEMTRAYYGYNADLHNETKDGIPGFFAW